MLSVRDSEKATQLILQNLNSAAAHYYRQYYTDPTEHCAVAVWPRGGHPTETDQRCGVISSVMTLTGNPPEKPRFKLADALRLCCVFCNCMEYSATRDVFIVDNIQSYETSWSSVKITAVTLVNTMVLDMGMGLGLSNSNAIFLYAALQIHKYKNRL
jgi:hypothetical protein